MVELIQLILEHSSSAKEILAISFFGICFLHSLNLRIVDMVLARGTLARVVSIGQVKTDNVTTIFPVTSCFDPTSHIRILRGVSHHPCDLNRKVDLFSGEILRPYIEVYQKIPNAFNSKPINNPTTLTIRSP